ncbi:UDP-N-acetylmuramoylalanyl-D-glutamate--2,6-diaminopimelate ligase [Arthrobacter alpinus]|uniref:UDP-N-acetylmuramoyl-L-alanyl-D-glutamate--2, 6-diaminopimelate ligase n=1 Tax=Arthrobacter alpinus TaxID=656366 RepID=UPI0005C9DE09|nr:UDP-N-acetylmuramoylalanyl-D-glutamate--2,6-diaminopimelate ligase [Arthrobacter alpinus]
MKEKDLVQVPVNNSPAPLRPQHHAGVELADLAALVGAMLSDPRSDAKPLQLRGVTLDSRAVCPGDLYVALPGARAHGAQFAAQAVAAGAVAVLTDDAGTKLLGAGGSEPGLSVPVLTVADARAVTGAAAARVYGASGPSDSNSLDALELFAVTGTNGKTTTTYFLNALLQALGNTTGLIGTIEILAGSEAIPSKLTTPESTDIHALLAVMAEKGLSAASMEVSSHALAFGRVDAVTFNVAGFTNLTQDHLDLHGGMEGYFQTKAALFTPEHAKAAVVTVDDVWGRRMAAACTVPVVTLSTRQIEGADDPHPMWQVRDVRREGIGSRFTLAGPDGATLEARTGLPGDFNVSNAALALLMVTTRLLALAAEPGTGVAPAAANAAQEVLARIQTALDDHDPFTVEVPGRMQIIGAAPVAVVDFAHNPDALERALDAVRPSAQGARVIAVFGATGERDATKRPIMGAVVARGADVVLITDDDPHNEDPAAIRAEVLAGAHEANRSGDLGRVVEEFDSRAQAIARAVELATPQDVILVAGRGHEVYQEVKGVNISLDDRVELRAALASRGFPLSDTSKIESSTDD